MTDHTDRIHFHALAQDWVRDYARHRVAGSYRDGNAREVRRWGAFLSKAG
jgi:hypothetical protein